MPRPALTLALLALVYVPSSARPDGALPSSARFDAALPSSARPDEALPSSARLDAALPALQWGHLFVTAKDGTRGVAPEVEALRGRKVTVTGFMARMEEAPRGALYLARRPVEADESGGGTADLPPEVIRVEIPRLAGEEVAWTPGPIEAIGRLEVGRAEDAEGRVSWIRVVVDGAAPDAAAIASRKLPAEAAGSTRSNREEDRP